MVSQDHDKSPCGATLVLPLLLPSEMDEHPPPPPLQQHSNVPHLTAGHPALVGHQFMLRNDAWTLTIRI